MCTSYKVVKEINRIISAKHTKVLDKSIKILPPGTKIKIQKIEFDKLNKKVSFKYTMPTRNI